MNAHAMVLISLLPKHSNKKMRIAIASLIFLVITFINTTSFAQDAIAEFQYMKVGDINIQADGPVDAAQLLDLIEITPNVDIVTTSKIRKSIELLYATGNFSNIIVHAEKQQDRAVLTFVLKLIYRFESIDVDGKGGPPYGKIRKGLKLRKYEPYLPEKVLRGREELLESLKENGYPQAHITPDVVLFRETKRAKVTYIIDPGPATYVGKLTFTGDPHFTYEELSSRMKSTPGRHFKPQQLDRDLERIEDLYDKSGYLEHEIKLTKQELDSANRVNLEIQITAGRPVVLEIEGFKLSQDEIDETLPIRSEHSYHDDTLEEGRRNLIQFLQRKGYYDADVIYKKIIANENIVVRYVITPEKKFEVDHISISGNQHLSRDHILDFMTTQESGFRSKPLVQRDFEADQGKIISAYKEEGFLFARIIKSDVNRRPEGKIDIDIQIDEGPQVTLSEYRFHGNQIISSEELTSKLSQKIGEPIGQSRLKNDSRYIVSIYSERGYPKMQLENKLLLSRDRTHAVIEYQINEGEQVFVDRVVISGNYRTKRKIIEDALLFGEDDPLSLRKIAASASKLYGLEIFDRVDIDIPRPDNLLPHQPVQIKLTEAKPYTVTYGVGYDSYNYVNGVFTISNRNWLGIDRGISLRTRGGVKEYQGLLTLEDPHLFQQNPSTLSGVIENQSPRNSFSYFRYATTYSLEKKLSRPLASLEPGEKVPPLSSLFFGYGFEHIDTTGTPELTPQNRQFLDIHISYLNTSYVRDSRDNQIDPYRGTFFSTSAEWATSYLGSQTDFLKTFYQFQHFFPLQRTSVFATSLRLGLAKGFRDTVELPLQRRFFAGGGRTIRGFELDTAGPLDENGEPLGGNAVFVMNLEYRFPVVSSFGGVIFFDYGSAFSLVEDMNFGDMRKTAGVGIRYHTPIGPLTLDWGYKLDRRFQPIRESPSEFFLSVGHAF
jgi:outer membrane protein insertion porin family